jgi:DNA-binding NtrC family response regulator
VRELQNALESAVALNRSGVITPEELPPKVCAETGNGQRLEDLFTDLPALDVLGGRYLAHVLKVTGMNKAKAAAILDVDRKTLYRMIEKLKLRV